MSVNGIGVTQAELDRKVRAKLSEASARFFTAQNLLDWENEAQDVIAVDAPFTVVSTWHSQTIANQPRYQLDPSCMVPTGTLIRDSGGTIRRLSYEEPDVDNDARNWNVGASQPTVCSYENTLEGSSVLLWPTPNAVLDFYVEGHKRPTLLSVSTDRTDIPPYLVQAVLYYVLWQAKAKDEESTQGDRWEAAFRREMDRLAEIRMKTQADQNPQVRYFRSMSGGSWPFSRGDR